MAAPDPAVVARFRDAVAAALSASDRSAFDAATRALAAASHLSLPDALTAPLVQADPHLPTLLSLAADLRWLRSDLYNHPIAATSSQPTHVFRPPSVPPRPFVPTLPHHPIPLPTAPVCSPTGPKASFRSWKWNRPVMHPHDSNHDAHLLQGHSSSHLNIRPSYHTMQTMASNSKNFQYSPFILDADDLFSAMHPSVATRPAAAAAAAAFHALTPFLRPRTRAVLRSTIASSTPLQALSAVMRAAHEICTNDPENVLIPLAAGVPASMPAWPTDPTNSNGLPFTTSADEQHSATAAWPASRVWTPDARETTWGAFSSRVTAGIGASNNIGSQSLQGLQTNSETLPPAALPDVTPPFLNHTSLN